MSDLKFIAQGGFNSGRLYSNAGQRIFWAQREDGWLYFNDIDRMIAGWIKSPYEGEKLAKFREIVGGVNVEWLLKQYDAGRYEFYPEGGLQERPPSVPEGFDFGPKLRI